MLEFFLKKEEVDEAGNDVYGWLSIDPINGQTVKKVVIGDSIQMQDFMNVLRKEGLTLEKFYERRIIDIEESNDSNLNKDELIKDLIDDRDTTSEALKNCDALKGVGYDEELKLEKFQSSISDIMEDLGSEDGFEYINLLNEIMAVMGL